MQFHFTLTVAEIGEAVMPATQPAKSRLIAIALGGVMTVGLMITIFVMTVANARDEGSTIGRLYNTPGNQNLWSSIVPALVAILFIVAALYNQRVKRRRLNQADAAEPMYATVRATMLPLVALLLLVIPQIRQIAIIWAPTPVMQSVIGLTPWIVALYVIGIGQKFRRRLGKKALVLSPGGLRTRTITVDETGVRTQDGVTDQHADWPFYVRCRETKNLIVLINEDIRAIMIPKRVITDPASLIALKAILQSHILQCEFLYQSTGFPVAPVQMPVPVMTLSDQG